MPPSRPSRTKRTKRAQVWPPALRPSSLPGTWAPRFSRVCPSSCPRASSPSSSSSGGTPRTLPNSCRVRPPRASTCPRRPCQECETTVPFLLTSNLPRNPPTCKLQGTMKQKKRMRRPWPSGHPSRSPRYSPSTPSERPRVQNSAPSAVTTSPPRRPARRAWSTATPVYTSGSAAPTSDRNFSWPTSKVSGRAANLDAPSPGGGFWAARRV